MPLLIAVVCGALLLSGHAETAQRGKAEHVVVVVWDGLRPDFVTEATTPTLWKMAAEGVTFRQHHSVYPTSTQVNGTALATGVYPSRSGVLANAEYRPGIKGDKPVAMDAGETMRKGDELTGGKYLASATIAELVRAAGGNTAVAGTKGVARLHDRMASGGSLALFAGETIPVALRYPLIGLLGPFPLLKTAPNSAQDWWTTQALTQNLWKESVPPFSVLWLSDPDTSQHKTAPGSPVALSGLKSSDDNLAAVLAELERQGVREKTDVFVVSDHGFSTIERSVDLLALMKASGFKASLLFTEAPQPGEIMVVGNGGTVLFYVMGRDEPTLSRLVSWLQQSDFAGVICTRQPSEGTFSLDQVHLATAEPPDVVMAFRWREGTNEFGVPGLIMADWNRKPGFGTHATFSKYDVHNTLIAAGPDFRRGFASDLPSGNIDVAPTILHLLGINPPQVLDGRVLSEAFVNPSLAGLPKVQTERIEVSREFPEGRWSQYLQVSKVGKTTYFDEGNGGMKGR